MKIIYLILPFLVFALSCGREGNPYGRIKDGHLQVASKSFVKAGSGQAKITLLGVVHVGEQAFYEEIQRRLNKADVVLYERVATPAEIAEMKKNCPYRKSKCGGHSETAKVANLACQSDHIRKRHGNFVHADISLAEMLDRQGVARMEPLCRRLDHAENTSFKDSDKSVSEDDSKRLRNKIAFSLVKGMNFAPEFADENTKFIRFDRNKYIFNKLKDELPKYGESQEIVIFYGVGHMPDVEAHLVKMGYELESTDWLSAFSL